MGNLRSSHAKLAARFAECVPMAARFEAVVIRSTAPNWSSSRHLVSGWGSHFAGGRWNPPGACRAVYASLDIPTATAEIMGSAAAVGVPEHAALPRVLVAIDVRLHSVLDMRARTAPAKLGLTRRDMTRPDWRAQQRAGREPITQVLGRLAFQSGLEGLVVPSAQRRGGWNLVWFPDNMIAPSLARPIDPPRLRGGR